MSYKLNTWAIKPQQLLPAFLLTTGRENKQERGLFLPEHGCCSQEVAMDGRKTQSHILSTDPWKLKGYYIYTIHLSARYILRILFPSPLSAKNCWFYCQEIDAKWGHWQCHRFTSEARGWHEARSSPHETMPQVLQLVLFNLPFF